MFLIKNLENIISKKKKRKERIEITEDCTTLVELLARHFTQVTFLTLSCVT
jgi:hypothetical protein